MMGRPDDFRAELARAAAVAAGGVGWERFLKGLPDWVRRGIFAEFTWQAHGGQAEPEGHWRVWLLMAGRGFGKTRAGAEWIWARARETPGAQIALVGGSRDEVVKVMVEGPSGLIAVAREDEAVEWGPTQGVLRFPRGAEAFIYSAAAPEKLRGPEHHFAWADELAKWPAGKGRGDSSARGAAAWDNLMMGLRAGAWPRAIVTTTPRSVALLRRVRAGPGTVETNGRSAENVHLSQAVRAWLAETYGGTRLGRQELEGKLFENVEGSLFPRELLERCRVGAALAARRERVGAGEPPVEPPYLKRDPGVRLQWWQGRDFWRRIVVGVDPPAGAEGDACGIVVCGLGADDMLYVLADCSVAGMRPEGWARAVVSAVEAWEADRVVAERNQGGDMVGSVLRGVEAGLPVKLVHASIGKSARAEPVAARFEGGRAKLGGFFPELEDELTGLKAAGGYEGAGSPDRADAMVWAMTELMGPVAEPRVRVL